MDFSQKEELAQRLNDAHDVHNAISTYREILLEAPHNHRARGALARLLMEVSRYGDAQDVCQEGLALGDSGPVLAALSECYQAHFRVPEAIAVAQRAIETDISCGFAWFALSAAYGLAGEERAADDAITDGLAACGDHPELLIEHATRPELSPSEQVAGLRQLRERFPNHRGALASLAILLSSADQEREARTLRELLIERNRESHFSQAIHGMHLLLHDRHDEARPYIERALELWPCSFYGLYSRFLLHIHDAQLALANATLDEADALTQGTSIHATFVVQMMTTIDGPEGPRQISESYVQQRPQSAGMRLAYAELVQLCGEADEALTQLRIARELAPQRYDLKLSEGRLLVEMRRFDEAALSLAGLDENAEIDGLRTRITASQLTDPVAIRSLYEAHLVKYPKLDFAWGLLLRDAVECGDLARVQRLVSEPFRVPTLASEAAYAYVHANQGDALAASQSLNAVLAADRVAIHWVWAWEFAVEATEYPALGLFRSRVVAAAEEDGYLFEA